MRILNTHQHTKSSTKICFGSKINTRGMEIYSRFRISNSTMHKVDLFRNYAASFPALSCSNSGGTGHQGHHPPSVNTGFYLFVLHMGSLNASKIG